MGRRSDGVLSPWHCVFSIEDGDFAVSPCFVHWNETEAQGGMGLGLGGAACISLHLSADSRKPMKIRVSSNRMGFSSVGQDGALKGIWVEAWPLSLSGKSEALTWGFYLWRNAVCWVRARAKLASSLCHAVASPGDLLTLTPGKWPNDLV